MSALGGLNQTVNQIYYIINNLTKHKKHVDFVLETLYRASL